MPTPQEKLDAMLDAYQAAHKTSTTDPGKQLRELIETTPGLKDTFLDQIDKDRLKEFVPLTTPGALGTYDAYDKTMAVSIDQLNTAAGGDVQIANSLRFTLGHEINHAVTRDARLTEDKTLKDSIESIAASPSPHDYTATLKAYNDSARSREVGAEIAGFNVLAGYVRSKNPSATLKDMYDASPNDMAMYVDKDESKTPATYTPKAGLTLDSDLKMASTQANIDAMGEHFYKATGYPERKIGGALDRIATAEQDALRIARISDPGHVAPEIRVDLKTVGAETVPLPTGFTDTSSPRLQPPAQPGPSGGERSDPQHAAPQTGTPQPSFAPTIGLPAAKGTPADPNHPDRPENDLLEKIRGGVRGLDQQAGKPWDDQSERLSASLLALATEKKFSAQDDLKIAFNKPTATYAAGELIHVARVGNNASPDPAANRGHIATAEALSMPADQSYAKVATIQQTQAETAQLEQQQAPARGPDDPSKGAPKISL